jgi:hypothetical protein
LPVLKLYAVAFPAAALLILGTTTFPAVSTSKDERGHPATSLRDLRMLLREIGRLLRKLSRLRRMGASETVPERNQILECGAACSSERRNGSEPRSEVRHGANGHGTPPSAPIRRKTEKPACASASAGKNVSPGDIARRILGANSGATISKVLVVGTDRSELVTRMEIRFADPERVPATFTSLAATLQSSGFDLNTLGNSSIPIAEIWLTYPLNDRNKTLLSCAARVGEQQAAGVAVQAGSPRGQTGNHASVSTGRS